MSKWFEKLSQWTRSMFGLRYRSRSFKRLANAICVMETDFKAKPGAGTLAWAANATEFLDGAREAHKKGNLQGGWAFVLQAERAAIEGLTDAELEARIIALEHETDDKLKSWRQSSAKEILAKAKKESDGKEKRALVQEMLHLRNEHFQNMYRQLDIQSTQLASIGVVLIGVIGLILADSVGIAARFGDDWLSDARVAALFGLFGGALSAMFSVTRSDPDRKIPEQLRSFVITSLRPFIGAGAAVAVYVLLRAGTFSFMDNDVWAIAGLAFLSGFSEQFLFRIVESSGAKAA